MERKIEATILDVESKEVRRKRDQALITIYTVTTDKGQASTSIRRIAEDAYNHRNEPMLLTLEEKERDGYPSDFYLNKVELPFGGEGTTQPRERKSQFQVPDGQQKAFNGSESDKPGLPEPKPVGLSGAEKDESIYRQTATKVAAWLVGPSGSAEDFQDNVFRLMHFYRTGEFAPDSFDDTPDTSGGRQFIPEGADAGPTGGGEFSDDDIPF